MVTRIKEIHYKLCQQPFLLSLILALLIFSSLAIKQYLPIVGIFIYVAFFNKKLMVAMLISLPLYDSYFKNMPLSLNKIIIIIFMISLLYHIKYKKIQIRGYEITILLLLLTITFGEIVALLNPDFLFIRHEIFLEYLLELLPKVGFILTFVLAIRTNKAFSIKDMTSIATYFVPIFMIGVLILSFITKTNQSISRYNVLGLEPNYFSVFSACLLPLTIYAYFTVKEKIMIGISILSMGGQLYLLSLTSSRTGVLLVGFSIIVTVLVCAHINKKRLMLLGGLAIVGIIAIFFIPYFDNLIRRLTREGLTGSLRGFLNGRYEMFESAIYRIRQNPLLGYGGTKEASGFYIFQDTGIPDISHNAYLDIFVQYGIYGIIVFVGMYLYIVSEGVIKAIDKRHRYDWQLPYYVTFINLLIAGMLLSLTFRDMYIYSLAFVLALPYRKTIEGRDNDI